jgi:hypothetical protein
MVLGRWTMRTRGASSGQPLLVLVEEVGGLEGVVAADGDEGVDARGPPGRCTRCAAARSCRVVEILGALDALAGVGARGADDDAPAVAQVAHVPLLKDPVVLVGQQPVADRVVVLQVRVAVEEADDLAPVSRNEMAAALMTALAAGAGPPANTMPMRRMAGVVESVTDINLNMGRFYPPRIRARL